MPFLSIVSMHPLIRMGARTALTRTFLNRAHTWDPSTCLVKLRVPTGISGSLRKSIMGKWIRQNRGTWKPERRIKRWNVSNNNMVAFTKFHPDSAHLIFYVCLREWIAVYVKSVLFGAQANILKSPFRKEKLRGGKVVFKLEKRNVRNRGLKGNNSECHGQPQATRAVSSKCP